MCSITGSFIIVVREANQYDICCIQKLLEALAQDGNVHVLEEQINFFRDSGNNFLLVAEVSGAVVGTVQLNICPDAMYKTQPYALIENIIVEQTSEKQGIGKALLSKVEEICVINNCSKIMLLSSSQRSEAHNFFDKVGYSGSTKKGFVKYASLFNVKHT
ncbi:GNAT family N-acetyltransferase [Colwellia sp. 12G3]|uniref:GNAT family N-acetyltransferase n=1 Tax=Colwellia sp. 12G3 TaxID=2058299 RepID=UPI0012FE9613|nr:GNAT family N-acetyltransferase [Colwellia sp. 12G3]